MLFHIKKYNFIFSVLFIHIYGVGHKKTIREQTVSNYKFLAKSYLAHILVDTRVKRHIITDKRETWIWLLTLRVIGKKGITYLLLKNKQKKQQHSINSLQTLICPFLLMLLIKIT